MAVVRADEFGLLIRKWADKTGEDLEKVARGFCINLSTNVILKTPVGNPDLWLYKHPTKGYVDYLTYKNAPAGYVGGRARNNWFASIGSPSTKQNKTPDKSGRASVKRINTGASRLEAGQTFYLTNNLPYIRRLEYEGWSTQAPAGMMRISLAEAEQSLIKAINSI